MTSRKDGNSLYNAQSLQSSFVESDSGRTDAIKATKLERLQKSISEVDSTAQEDISQWIGVILKVIENPNMEDLTTDQRVAVRTSDGVIPQFCKVRIPSKDSMLPEPISIDSAKPTDHDFAMECHATFVLIDPSLPVPAPGDIVFCDFLNRKTREGGVITGFPDKQAAFGGLIAGPVSSVNVGSLFDNQNMRKCIAPSNIAKHPLGPAMIWDGPKILELAKHKYKNNIPYSNENGLVCSTLIERLLRDMGVSTRSRNGNRRIIGVAVNVGPGLSGPPDVDVRNAQAVAGVLVEHGLAVMVPIDALMPGDFVQYWTEGTVSTASKTYGWGGHVVIIDSVVDREKGLYNVFGSHSRGANGNSPGPHTKQVQLKNYKKRRVVYAARWVGKNNSGMAT